MFHSARVRWHVSSYADEDSLTCSLTRKAKGDLAELKVATDLIERGYMVALPYGEDWDFDLVLVARRQAGTSSGQALPPRRTE